jgi:hypothetical protein
MYATNMPPLQGLLVPTFHVGTRSRTLRVQYAAERQDVHSDAERRNENLTALPPRREI